MGLTGIEDTVLLLREAAHAADLRRSAGVTKRRRLEDALDVVMTLVAQQPTTPTEWAERMAELESAVRAAADCARDVGDDATETARPAVHEGVEALRAAMETHARDLDTLMPWARLRVSEAAAPTMQRLATTMSLAELPRRCEATLHDLATRRAVTVHADDPASTGLRGIDTLASSLERSGAAAAALVQRLTQIADDARAMVTAMEFGFLFDPTRVLFAIGYRMTDGSLDPGRTISSPPKPGC